MSASLLTLDFGKPLPEGEPSPWRETYELVDTVRAKAADLGKEHFRLIALHAHDGAALGLRYDHVVAGEEVLSDIISKQGEIVVAHAGTQTPNQALDRKARYCAYYDQDYYHYSSRGL